MTPTERKRIRDAFAEIIREETMFGPRHGPGIFPENVAADRILDWIESSWPSKTWDRSKPEGKT